MKDKEDLVIEMDTETFKDHLFGRDNSRYKIIKGYKIDRYIMKSAFFVFILMLFFTAKSYDFDLDYMRCDASNYTGPLSMSIFNHTEQRDEPQDMCKNPFFNNESWKNKEYLPDGEYGLDPGEWRGRIKIYTAIIFLIALIVNHFLSNGGTAKNALRKLWKQKR